MSLKPSSISLQQRLMGEVQGVLKEKGLGDFQLKELELIPETLMKQHLSSHPADLSTLSQLVNERLQSIGMGHLRVKTLDLAMRVASPCPVGEMPTYVCDQLPDGSVRCSIKCKKAIP